MGPALTSPALLSGFRRRLRSSLVSRTLGFMLQGSLALAVARANQTREQKSPFAATLGSPGPGPVPLQTPAPSHMEKGCVLF